MPASPGDDLNIPANRWNGMQTMLEQWLRSGRGPNLPKNRSLGGAGWCWIKNTTGSDRAAFEVMSISDLIVDVRLNESDPWDGHFCVGIAPTSDPLYSYAVLQEPAAKSGGIARAIFSGVTLVKLNITNEFDMWCDVSNGIASYLTTHCLGGSRIILKNFGTGSELKGGLIRIGDRSGEILVKNETGISITAGGAGTASVWSGASGSEVATGQSITVRNKTSVDWENLKFGSAALLGGYGPYVSPLQRS